MKCCAPKRTAQSVEQLSDAIDRLAVDIRNGLGEGSDSINRTSLPLAKEATSNLDALQAYSAGVAFVGVGALSDAQLAFEHAVALDPHFPQPYLRLADVYRQERATVAAASAATTAQANAASAGDRTQMLAQASLDLNASGDLVTENGLLQKLLTAYPNSIAARLQAANAYRAQGKFADAVEVMQGALQRSPLHSPSLAATETAFISLERPDQAAQLELQSARTGHPHADLRLLLTYLASGGQGPIDITTDAAGPHAARRHAGAAAGRHGLGNDRHARLADAREPRPPPRRISNQPRATCSRRPRATAPSPAIARPPTA